MSNTKAVIYTILFSIVVWGLLFATAFVKLPYGLSLYFWIMAGLAGMWIGDRILDFYRWLRKR